MGVLVRDMFGSELFEDDYVVFADRRLGSEEIGLDLYVIVEITDGIVKGLLSSGEDIGCVHYLTDTHERAARILNPYKTAECFGDTLLS
jgi:hypothetical protein